MEYGDIIWQGSKYKCKLSAIQCKALWLYLGLTGIAGTEGVEVAAGIPPLDLHFMQISIREMAKIQAKSFNKPIKVLLNNMIEQTESQATQFYHMDLQSGQR